MYTYTENFHIGYWDYTKWRPIRGVKERYSTRKGILHWYFIAWIKDWVIPAWRGLDCYCGKGRRNRNKHNNKLLPNNHWKYHHKACYGPLILLRGQNTDNETYEGIAISEYCQRYEKKRKQKIEAKDKQLLKQLAPSTLFCKFCFRPFVEENVYDELATPYLAALDYVSAVLFVAVPIVWIPLIIFFTITAFIQWLLSQCSGSQKGYHDSYHYTDYDKEVC